MELINQPWAVLLQGKDEEQRLKKIKRLVEVPTANKRQLDIVEFRFAWLQNP